METQAYDLVVVGGGVAGLYCGLHAEADWTVALFEGSHRIGGKLETISMHGFDAEYGAMRFDPVRQPLVGKLLAELGVETVPFPEYSSPPAQKRRLNYALDDTERHLDTLELHALAIQRVLEVSAEELLALGEEQLEAMRRENRLWEQGLWNVFDKVISHDAIRYIIMEGSFFHFIHENPSAAGWMITWVKMLQMSRHLRGIKNGMQSLPNAMLERLRQRNAAVHEGHMLTALEPSDRDRVRLHFANGVACTARHVVLALPEHALSRIQGLPPGIKTLFGSVLDIPLLKCFFVIDDPWWDEDIPNADVPALPAREVHYQRADGKGLVMVYADRPYLNFWSQYLRKGYETRAEIDGNKDLPAAFARFMGIDPKRILSAGIRHWGTEPYGAACHLWKPNVQAWKVQEKMAAFALERNGPANIHVCGEAFSDYQGFMEGALRTAEKALEKMTR